MKTNLLNHLKKALGAASAATLLALAAPAAQASIVDGYYVGELPNYGLESQVYVTTVKQPDGSNASFGVIVAENDSKRLYGAAFRITELTNGLQRWVQLFQNDAGQLTFEPGQRATYDVRTVHTGKSWRSARLQFTVTDFGKQLGCVDAVTRAKLRSRIFRRKLAKLPSHRFKIEEDGRTSAYYENRNLTGTLDLGSKLVQGDFEIMPKFASSMGEMRQNSSDPESDSGLIQKKSLMGLIVSTQRNRLIGTSDYRFFVIDVPSVDEVGRNTNICFAPAGVVEQD